MTSIANGSVKIQTTSEPNFSTPSWFGEVVVISRYLRQHEVLSKINEQVRFTRKRFGRYEVIDFLAVLFGYAISGERALEEFYESLQPFAIPFMTLFERDRLPSRSALSRFLAALTEAPVEALRALFLADLLARPLTPGKQTGGLVDRAGKTWIVFDIDGTREAARQRALPQTDELPPPFRRLDDVCAPGYRGRKRGEVVRTQTTVSQAHSYQWLGSFGNRGNGRYREELRKGCASIGRYLTAYHLDASRTLLRLDGQYGNGAVLTDVAGFSFVTRGKDYHLLDHPLIQARLHLPPDQFQQRPESQMVRSLYDCPQIPVGPEGVSYRVVVATHPAGKKKSPVGVTRTGMVYELFFTNLPQHAFTACDVVELYMHRGAFEPILADEGRPGPRPVVQSFGLGTRSLAVCGSMGLEPAFGTRPSPSSRSGSYDRVCACSPASLSTHAPFLRVCSSRGGLCMEGRSLLGPRFHAPPRWDTSLSSQPGASYPGTAPRSRQQPAHRVRGQHSQLPVLSVARAVSMAGACHEEAAPGQPAASSAGRWSRTTALAGLEPQRASACLPAARVSPTHRDVHPPASSGRFASHCGSGPFSCRASTHSSLLESASGSQCAQPSHWPDHHHTVRRSRGVGHLPSPGLSVTGKHASLGF
ncbi:hypothetical protein [Ktedonobacter racemifer]|uniref:Uncharacterized protein n=1 Tax=Ktedonobacter racemifer DSM 44963 TaxID=485913 RepID=D6U1N7_KTERA|nr:hypothetical protein [Ktedonobacter racemifer]EFH82681.1 hypothetical protein Krac_3518 [Ktedonobacter racemifer DSM 44963]